jgi:hypothetical protein
MEKLDSLTGRGATRVMLSVFEGMGRSVEEREGVAGQARLPEGKRSPAGSHDHVSHGGHADCLARFDYGRPT